MSCEKSRLHRALLDRRDPANPPLQHTCPTPTVCPIWLSGPVASRGAEGPNLRGRGWIVLRTGNRKVALPQRHKAAGLSRP